MMTVRSPMPSTTRNKVNYSPMEKVVLGVLQDAESPIDTIVIINKVYKKLRRDQPFNARVIVGGHLRSLKRKCKYNKEPWRIISTVRHGPYPMFWHLQDQS